MPKHRKTSDLPSKICATCGRPFTWRKKWETVWDEVRYCSQRCRGARAKPQGAESAGGTGGGSSR